MHTIFGFPSSDNFKYFNLLNYKKVTEFTSFNKIGVKKV